MIMELRVWDSQAPAAQQQDIGNSNNNTCGSTPKLTLSHFQDILCFLEDFSVVVCKQHCTAIVNINTHLKEHHATTARLRKQVVEHFKNFSRISTSAIQLPEQPAYPITELGAPLDGLKCRTCDFITVNVNVIRMHCKKSHQQTWTGRVSNLFEDVKVQTFFRTGGLQKYFIVDVVSSRGENGSVVEQQLAEWLQERTQLENELNILGETAKQDNTGWYKRTGWPLFLKDRNLLHIGHQARLPDRDETKLKLGAELTEYLIEKCVKGLSTLPDETRRWLRSVQLNTIDPRPIARLQNAESQAVYASYMKRFVCFYLRIIADEECRVNKFNLQRSRGSPEIESSESDRSDSEYEEHEDSSEEAALQRRRRRQKQGRQDMMKDARELFRFTKEQHMQAIRLWTMLDSDSREAQVDALLDSLSSFIFVNYTSQPLAECGLVQFLAVLGIDMDSKRLRKAKDYSYMLAGLVYCVRVLSIEKILPANRRDNQTDNDRDRFLAMRKRYLVDGSYSPMSTIISLLAYGKSIALSAGNSGNAYWSWDKKTYYLNGRPISVERFCSMAQSMVADVTEQLWQLCWVDRVEDRFSIDLAQIADDLSFTTRGMSFVSEARNCLSNGLTWMLTRARESEGGMKLQTSEGKWRGRQIRHYLVQVDCFLELLLGCVHVTSGQPGRGPEITTIRHRNGVLQDRNVFVADGAVMTVVRYHKSQSQWDKPKVIPRFLPPQLGQVMAVYLAYVQPFREYLTVQVLRGGLSDYVWGNEHGAWATDRLTKVLLRETGKRLGVPLHTLDYRHTAVGIGREKIGASFGRGYQDEVGEVEEEAEVEEDGEDIVELQNSRTTAMGVGNYSVPIDIVKHLSARSMEAFRVLSTAWHRFLGVDGSRPTAGTEDAGGRVARKRVQRPSTTELALLPREKSGRVEDRRAEALQAALQDVLGKREVSFRSAEQEQAMHAVLDRQTPLVVVLPTGGGKSLLFMVPACMEEDGVTVVVVPYRALTDDLVQRIKGRGISCLEWKHGETSTAQVVVVSADVAGDLTSKGNFISYAGLLQRAGKLRRIVVDECHLVFTSSDWRPKLAGLKNLRLVTCPIVVLTATLPPVREDELALSMLIRNATYIRASTVRPNTRYFVSWCKRGKGLDTALAMCKRRDVELRRRRLKGVVYCKSQKQCDEMAELLGSISYHAGLVDRGEYLQEWLIKGGLITATSALGTGVDYEGIVFILHVGMPWSMIDFAQESGRGGRGGEQVDSIVVVEEGEVEAVMKKRSEEIDVQAMGQMLLDGGCRRELMSRYLDGWGVGCRDIESVGCDRCGEGVGEWLGEQEQQGSEWGKIERKFNELRQGCVICWVLGVGTEREEEWKDHRTMQCERNEGIGAKTVDVFRVGIREQGDTHSCRRCWVSQKYCATGESIANKCQWPNVVVPLVYVASGTEEGQEVIRQSGYYGDDWEEYKRWLGKRHRERVWGEFFSNAMVLAIRMVERLLGRV